MTRDSQKRLHFCKALLCIATLLFLSACASGYNARAASAHRAYFRGDYGKALELIDEVKPARRDRLLYLLDKGMFLHAAGEYERSNRVLTRAEGMANALYAKSITREVAATLWSEEARDYHGERHERALIPVIRMLNYIMLDDWQGALVEVRKLNNTIEDIYGTEYKYRNAFSLYLSAIIWEAMGQMNDALIDYKRLAKEGAEVPYYGHDMKAASARLAMPVSYPSKGSTAWQKSPGYRTGDGELVVIASAGRSPRFVSHWVSTGYFSVSMPRVETFEPSYSSANVIVDGKEIGSTYPFYNIADDIMIALKERSKRSMVRKMVKLSVQTGLYTAGMIMMESDETEHQLAGLAMSILAMSMAATDKADERSWRSLPANFQIGRFYLKPGEHEVEIVPEGGGRSIRRSVTISKGKPAVIVTRFGDATSIASRRGLKEYGEAAKAREKEVEKEARMNPKDGNLKLKLARARMESGNYNVGGLIKEGMRLGGSRREGMLLMLTSLTVREAYPEAIRWAKKGKKEGLGNQYAYYEEALAYASIKTLDEPKAASPKLTEDKSSENAFNHYIAGLVYERAGDYDDATEHFAKAYEYGLRGEDVIEHVVENYKQTNELFKESEQGVEIITEFADSFVEVI